MTFTRHTLLCAFLAVASLPAPAGEQLADVRVLIDVSGSMKHNDPGNLRVPALRLLTGLMPLGARGGIWMFAESVEARLAHGAVDEAWKQRAAAAADAIHSRGQRTDIETALREATDDWREADADSRRSVILLTDGMVDTGSPTESSASRARILAEGVASLEASGAAVHVIALSSQADHELLRSLAIRTGGWYERAEDAGQLERLFLRMFEKAAQPDTVPIEGNRFSVDSSIEEMTVLVFRKPDSAAMRLIAPEDVAITAVASGDGVTWRAGNGYDMVTVQNPARGQWQIEAETDPDNRVMVVTDLRLDVTGLPSYVLPGTELTVAAALSDAGVRVVRGDFLRLVGMSTRTRAVDGEERELVMLDDGDGGDPEPGDGQFGTTVGSGDEEGVVHVTVTADSGTFVREKRFSLEVVWPVSARMDAGEPVQLVVTPRADVIDTTTLALRATFTSTGGDERELALLVGEDGVARASLDDNAAGGQVAVTVSARTLGGDPLELALPALRVGPPVGASAREPAPAPEPQAAPVDAPAAEDAAESPPESPPPDWRMAVVLAAAANVVAGLLLIGFLLWRRKRQQRDLATVDAALGAAA